MSSATPGLAALEGHGRHGQPGDDATGRMADHDERRGRLAPCATDRQGPAEHDRTHPGEAHGEPVGQVHRRDGDPSRAAPKQALAHGLEEEGLGQEAPDDDDVRAGLSGAHGAKGSAPGGGCRGRAGLTAGLSGARP